MQRDENSLLILKKIITLNLRLILIYDLNFLILILIKNFFLKFQIPKNPQLLVPIDFLLKNSTKELKTYDV